MKIPKEKKVKLIAYMFKDGTSTWWNRLKKTRIQEDRNLVDS